MDANYVVITNNIDLVNQTTKWVASEGVFIVEMHIIFPSIEEIFLELVDVELFVA